MLSITNQSFPRNLRCEIAGTSTGCDGDTSGVNSIAYRTYCVTVLDKVRPAPRLDPRMPDRRVDYDAMAYAFKDTREPLTTGHPDLPNKLTLWSQVTKTGMFFDPQVQGFTYVELYNPTYWMRTIDVERQDCFIPMYRMRARSTHSAVNGDVVAFWTTKYAGSSPTPRGPSTLRACTSDSRSGSSTARRSTRSPTSSSKSGASTNTSARHARACRCIAPRPCSPSQGLPIAARSRSAPAASLALRCGGPIGATR